MVPILGIFIFSRNFALDKFDGADFKYEYILSYSEVAGWRPVTLLKRDSETGVYLSILQKKIFHEKAPLYMFDTP